jgi:hypothetical protein
MILIKKKSGSQIFKNMNPRYPFKQKSFPNRITNRTYSVMHGLNEGNKEGVNAFEGSFSNRIVDTNRAIYKTLFGRIRGGGKKANNYVGTWSPYVRDDSNALKRRMAFYKKRDIYRRSKGKPTETPTDSKKDLMMSYLWELRGRPYLYPAPEEHKGEFMGCMAESFKELIKKFNMEK